ncbi:MAG TPA: hypothetical protein VEA58_10570 [Anaerovoracaceae bacterium]|nr:hypothetical protein [Anaerovoracaceae bacterium]
MDVPGDTYVPPANSPLAIQAQYTSTNVPVNVVPPTSELPKFGNETKLAREQEIFNAEQSGGTGDLTAKVVLPQASQETGALEDILGKPKPRSRKRRNSSNG